MGATKHEKTFVDYNKAYETNIIGLRGVIYFAVGLVILIVVTFGLMLILLNLVEDNADAKDRQNINPMTENMKESERLPPEPRLQAAPGFGVDSPTGRVNLELKAPQSEYNELKKIWDKQMLEGQKDAKTGTVVTLPIEEAKKKLLEQNVKANANGQKSFAESQMFYSYGSAGRLEADKRK
jgi:hypothetical protein